MIRYCSSPPILATPEVTYDFETHRLPRISWFWEFWGSGDLWRVIRSLSPVALAEIA